MQPTDRGFLYEFDTKALSKNIPTKYMAGRHNIGLRSPSLSLATRLFEDGDVQSIARLSRVTGEGVSAGQSA